jgi:hypothetical protein
MPGRSTIEKIHALTSIDKATGWPEFIAIRNKTSIPDQPESFLTTELNLQAASFRSSSPVMESSQSLPLCKTRRAKV